VSVHKDITFSERQCAGKAMKRGREVVCEARAYMEERWPEARKEKLEEEQQSLMDGLRGRE